MKKWSFWTQRCLVALYSVLLAGGTLSLGAAAWAAAARRVHCRVCVNRWWRPWPHRVVSFVKLPSVTSFGSSAPTALFYYFSIYWLRGLASQLYTQGTWGMRKRPPPVVPWFGVKRQLRQQHAFFTSPFLPLDTRLSSSMFRGLGIEAGTHSCFPCGGG